MSAASPQPQPHDKEQFVNIKKQMKTLSVFVVVLALLCITTAVSGFFFLRWKIKALEKAHKDLAFEQFVAGINAGQDFVQPTVNAIQFLHHGYSILFDKVEYTQNGLVLTGQVGNSTNLSINSLALNFSARPYPYKIRDKWDTVNGPPGFMAWWDDAWNIGTAQTTVGALNPGSTAFFEVTIPNVKQTPDNIEIAVWFSGERYQYLGK